MLCSKKRAHPHHSLLWISKVFIVQAQLLRRLLIRFRIRKLETNGNGVLRNLPNQCQHPTPLPNCCRLQQNPPQGNHVRTSLLPSLSRALPTLTLEHGRCKQDFLPSGVAASRHSSAVTRELFQRHSLLRLLLSARGSTPPYSRKKFVYRVKS